MPNMSNTLRTLKGTGTPRGTGTPAAWVLTVLALTSVGLTACGGSSGGTSSQTNAAATSATTTTGAGASSSTSGSSKKGNPPGAGPVRFLAMRECLQKNGLTLPRRTPGGARRPGAGGIFLGGGGAGGPQLPKGVTRAQFEAALKKCGGGRFPGAGGGPGVRRIESPVFRQALAKYAACLRQNGVNVPAPNTSGKGPVFHTRGLNTSSSQFKAATAKCRAALIGAFRGKP
jgi:hypothetical protein